MPRKLEVVITGDARQLERTLGRTGTQVETFGSKVKGMGKTAALAAGAAGLGAVVVVLKDSLQAAEEAQAAHALLSKAFKNVGLDAGKYASKIDDATAAGRNLGFKNVDVLTSLSKLITPTRDVGKAMKYLQEAEDLARVKHIGLQAASQILTGALAGNQRAVKQLGIVVPPVTSAVDALKRAHEGVKGPIDSTALAHAKLQDKLSTGERILDTLNEKIRGQSQAYSETAAGGMATFSAQLDNLEEKLGEKLLPILQSIVTFINSNWGTIGTVFSTVSNAVAVAVESIIAPMRVLWDLLHGDWSGAWKALSAPAVTAWNEIKGVIQPVVNLIKGALTTTFNEIRTLASSVWSAVSGSVTRAMSAVSSAITGAVKGAFEDAKHLGSRIVDGITGGLSGAAAAVGSAIGQALDAIGSFFKEAFNQGVKLAKKILGGIHDIIDAIKIPGIHLSIPYPTVSISTSTVDLGPLGSISIPTGVNLGIGHAGFDIPGFDPIPSFAVGGQVPGSSGPVPIMAHAGEFVIRADVAKQLGAAFLNNLNSFDSGGFVGDADYAAALRKRHGPWEPPKRWAPDEMRTGSVFRSMLERRYGSDIHFEDAWVQALYHANAGQIMSSGLGRPPHSISDLTSGQVWYDFPGGQWKIPALASGGRLLSDGLYYGHKGETVTPASVAGAGPLTTHITVELDGAVVGRAVTNYQGRRARYGGPAPGGIR